MPCLARYLLGSERTALTAWRAFMTTVIAQLARHAAGSWRSRPALRVSADPADVESVTIRYLMYVLVPAWFAPGTAGYLMHQRTRIERTSELHESAIHSLMMAEIAVRLRHWA